MTTIGPEEVVIVDEIETDNRRVVIAGGVVAAMLLGAAGYYLTKGGGEEDSAFVVPKGTRPAVTLHVAKPPKKVVKPLAKVPAVSTVKLGRDPFLALYTVPVAAPVVVVAPPATVPTGTTSGTSGTGTGTGSTPTSTKYSLTLLGITGTDAKLFNFNIDGVKKTVLTAQKFGKYGELVVLAFLKDSKGTPTGALLQVGDDDPVSIKIGEKITVL